MLRKTKESNYNQLIISHSIRLHTEIDHFYKYMQPTPIEHALRKSVIDRVNSTAQQIWPNASAILFGSYASGLTLPNSDIDLKVTGAFGKSPLHTLAAKLTDIAVTNSTFVRS